MRAHRKSSLGGHVPGLKYNNLQYLVQTTVSVHIMFLITDWRKVLNCVISVYISSHKVDLTVTLFVRFSLDIAIIVTLHAV